MALNLINALFICPGRYDYSVIESDQTQELLTDSVEKRVAVRRATISDAPVLANFRMAWESERTGELTIDEGKFTHQFISWLERNQHTNIPFICEIDDQPIGMAWLALITRTPRPTALVRISGDLQTVYIRPEYRNQGFGSDLIRTVIDECRTRKLLRLSVNINLEAIGFYQRLGFTRREKDFSMEL